MTNLEPLMTEKVHKCLQNHIGGEAYFTELDAEIKNDHDLLRKYLHQIIIKTKVNNFVMSGEIGRYYAALFSPEDINLFLLPGGLRHGKEVPYDIGRVYEGVDFVFLDDSYYSGRTLRAVKEYMDTTGANIVANYVFYDGSKHNIDGVKSIYRYYDHHNIH